MPRSVEGEGTERQDENRPDENRGGNEGYQGMDDDDSPRVMGEGMFEGFHVEQWSMRLHMAIVASLAFTIILVLMIVASRSWGVGERGEFEGMSAGLWKVCEVATAQDVTECLSWSEFCPNGVLRVRVSAAFSILSLLLAIAMVFIDYVEMTRPGAFRLHHPVMTIGHHLLWICLGLAWTCFTGAWEQSCGQGILRKPLQHSYKPTHYMDYTWGWMFIIWLWVIHSFTAVLLTLKLLGKELPCGL
eukprot:Rhum_TRINITY_DN4297_c0_g1::Rhum_TRINITY_DN4297_c0_g1_i1::g.13399::m.13399